MEQRDTLNRPSKMAMDALALVECQRITAMLESAVEKLGILASLTTDFHNEELNSMLGEEISRIIQEQVIQDSGLEGSRG